MTGADFPMVKIQLVEETRGDRTYDINVISNFRKLRELKIHSKTLWNGIYPVLCNFPYLQSLSLNRCFKLKWDLSMLSGCPQLRKLSYSNLTSPARKFQPTSNLSSLRILRNTLEVLKLGIGSNQITGNLWNLLTFLI